MAALNEHATCPAQGSARNRWGGRMILVVALVAAAALAPTWAPPAHPAPYIIVHR